jgi:uncharacterized protein YbjT (DUF2867 family)
MKITITGSLGHIGKPLVQELVKKGHSVTVISSQNERRNDIEALGGKAAIGTVEDVQFLASAFTGADAVYCMLPPPNLFDPNLDIMALTNKTVGNYVQAIQKSGVKQVVYLSSIGADMDEGNGMLAFHHLAEGIMKKLPSDVSITFIRPGGFYYNILNFINFIKTQGAIISNYGAEDIVPWVSPIDIAAAIAEEIVKPLATEKTRKVRYVASEELSCNEVARILGAAIGKPDLQWNVISDEQLLGGMKSFGMNPVLAKGFIDMNAAMHTGKLFEDYNRNKPALGKVKVKDFAKEFAVAFNRP